MSFVTGTVTECIYASTATGFTASSFTGVTNLNTVATMGVQAHLPPDFWLPNNMQTGRGIRIVARGILSTTSTPTFTWTVTAGGAASTAGAVLLGTGALTAGSGVSGTFWELEGDVILTAINGAGANSTFRGGGHLMLQTTTALTAANTILAPAWGGSAAPGTNPSTPIFDTSITNYINVNVACSASSSSNTCTLEQLLVFGLN